jgi:hypothetical protein
MDFFNYKNGELHCENVPAHVLAEKLGTPLYVYSKATLLHHYKQIADAFAPLNPTVCYSIKSNSNLNLCKELVKAGCGMDVTSGGELYRALAAGCDPKKIIYAGVGKTDEEIREAIEVGIAAFNIESEEEIENVDRVAASIGKQAIGAIRINPDVDPKTHVKTTTGKKETKFGVDIERAERVFEQYRNLKHLRVGGVHIHHFVFGMVGLLLLAYVWLLLFGFEDKPPRHWFRLTAFAYGVCSALILDEFALWLNLRDVYLERQGRESVEALAIFSGVFLWGALIAPFGWAVWRHLRGRPLPPRPR